MLEVDMTTQSEHGRKSGSAVLAGLFALSLLAATAVSCSTVKTGGSGQAAARGAAKPSLRHASRRPSPVRTRAPLGTVRPSWLGRRKLPLRPDGFGRNLQTPPALRDRRFPTIDVLPPPRHDAFSARLEPAPKDVLRRSTYEPKCPISAADLSYVRMSFWGFDHETHTGEMLVNSSVARALVGVFRRLYRVRFPIEELRITTEHDLRTHPTGDGNYSGSFECRPVTAGSSWSQHAYGLAVDVDPFQNPYVRPGLVVPELASAYENRARVRPGMIEPGGPVVTAFASIGWKWGGDWNSLKDYMHFSANGH